ncbi:uncharacterized protein LOC122294124 isoform X2 [Carya illinoinensis]|uniref:uncharacterized protein LOC122294124 isoform X2 n=1 Tax=Carya illinoinensis TaxID=32201 RepID=UPI001C71B065|nr:uncharacterized protein LOC122294124 isoform X2 [Carya illinoinensis]
MRLYIEYIGYAMHEQWLGDGFGLSSSDIWIGWWKQQRLKAEGGERMWSIPSRFLWRTSTMGHLRSCSSCDAISSKCKRIEVSIRHLGPSLIQQMQHAFNECKISLFLVHLIANRLWSGGLGLLSFFGSGDARKMGSESVFARCWNR